MGRGHRDRAGAIFIVVRERRPQRSQQQPNSAIETN